MDTYQSKFLLGILDEIVGRQLDKFTKTINFAIVGVQLLELNSFGSVSVDKLKDCLNFVLSKGVV